MFVLGVVLILGVAPWIAAAQTGSMTNSSGSSSGLRAPGASAGTSVYCASDTPLGSSPQLLPSVCTSPTTLCVPGTTSCATHQATSNVHLWVNATGRVVIHPYVQVVFVLETTIYDGVFDWTANDNGGGINGESPCSGVCKESNGVPFFVNNVAHITSAITLKNTGTPTSPGVTSSPHVTFGLVDYFSNVNPYVGGSADDHDDGDGSAYNVDVSTFEPASTFSSTVTTMATGGTLFGSYWISGAMSYADADFSDNFLDSSMITALYGALHGSGLGWINNYSTYHVIVWIGSTLPKDPSYQGDWCVTYNDVVKACKDPTLTTEYTYTFGGGLTMPTGETLNNITTLARQENVTIDAIDLPDGMTELSSGGYTSSSTTAQTDVNNILTAGCNLAIGTGGNWEGPVPASTGVGFTCAAAPNIWGNGNLTDTFRTSTNPMDAWANDPSLGWAITNVSIPSIGTITNASAHLSENAFAFVPAPGFSVVPGGMSFKCTSNGTDISSLCASTPSTHLPNGVAWSWPYSAMYASDVWSVSLNISVNVSFPSSLFNQSVPVDLCENTSIWTGCNGAAGGYFTYVQYTNFQGLGDVQSFPPAFVEVVSPGSSVGLLSISVSPAYADLNITANQTFTATTACTGGPCPAGITFVWSLTSTSLGILNTSTGNTVNFMAGGSTGKLALYVNGTLDFLTRQASPIPITITAPTPTLASVGVSPSTATVLTGGSQVFVALPTCSGGSCPAGISYSWSLNNSLGDLNVSTGYTVMFTAGVTGGKVVLNVSATLNGISRQSLPADIDITPSITSPALTSVSVTPTLTSLGFNGSAAFKATPTCSGTCPSGTVYSWTLTRPAMGDLNSSVGNPVKFTARATAGTVMLFVNATLNEKTVQSSPAEITISANPPATLTSVAVNPQSGTVQTGSTLQFSAVATCSSDPCPSGLSYAWTLNNTLGSSSPTSGSSTTFTAGPAVGTLSLTVTATLNGVNKDATASVSIIEAAAPTLESVTISPPSYTLLTGATHAFTATPSCTSGGSNTNCPAGVNYYWTLSNAQLGQLNPDADTVAFTAGNSAGTIILSVTALLNGKSVTSNATITITGSPSTGNTAPFLSGVTLYAIIGVVVAVIAVIAILLLARRKKKSQEAPSEQQFTPSGETSALNSPEPPNT